MNKRVVAALLVCALSMVVVSVPSADAGSHYVVRGDHGPRADAVTWEYTPADYGIWSGLITNNGLRSLTIDFYDNTTGVPVEIMHQKIRFASCGAYPTGSVFTEKVVLAPSHKYLVTAIPGGPKGSSCTVDEWDHFEPPVAVFAFSLSYLTLFVDGSASYDPDGVIVSYEWTFGDGSGATGITATHTYGQPGYYVVTLTVTDDDGHTGTASGAVMWPPPPIIIADFSFNVTGMQVTVDGSLSHDPDGMLVYYGWDFGDGSTATGITATHIYAMIGAYTITLKVIDNDGYSSMVSKMVIVAPPPPTIVSFTCYVSDLTVTVDASALDSYEYASFVWDWGDGTTGSGVIAVHTYGTYGDKTITLTVTDLYGWTHSLGETVALSPP